MISKSEGRVAVAGTILALVQSVGFIISLYLLVSNYTDEGRYDDPRQHVCVEALLCLMYRYWYPPTFYIYQILYRAHYALYIAYHNRIKNSIIRHGQHIHFSPP